jgi:hypothetical protein
MNFLTLREAEIHAQSALKKLKARKVRDAKISLTAALWYQELADRNLKQVREICEKIEHAAASASSNEKQ